MYPKGYFTKKRMFSISERQIIAYREAARQADQMLAVKGLGYAAREASRAFQGLGKVV